MARSRLCRSHRASRVSLTLAAFAATTPAVFAQTTHQVALNYNFNGIVHAGEAGLPDDPNGFRSISDRGLDFSGGVPNDPLLNGYQLIGAAGVLDIVHLGNRNTVDFGSKAFDAVADGDNIGTQPAWLANVDQTGLQTTVLAAPVLLETTSSASFLYQISNGGGSFDVIFDFQSGASVTAMLSGGDWFGGIYAGASMVDFATPGANLSITQGTVDLSAHNGEFVTQISFGNRSNANAGYAFIAARIETSPTTVTVHQIDLAYNFNGIVHVGEDALPDDPNGFRSISDRGLDFTAGVPNNPILAPYSIVDAPGVLDIVHLGNRNTVDNGNWAFDAVADGDNIGVQPNWLANVDQAGPQTTVLAMPITLTSVSSASFLYQISNGGGAFDVTFDFQSGNSVTAQLSGGDWFGGALPGRGQVDAANPDANLSLTEGTVDLGASAGELLTQITFSNPSSGVAGYAIIAANVTGPSIGTNYCLSTVNSTGFASTISAAGSASIAANDLVLTASNLPSQPGIFIAGPTQAQVPFFNGFLCISPVGLQRFLSVASPSGGNITEAVDLATSAAGGVNAVAGSSYHYQRWNRDPMGGGGNANFSDGIEIAYTP